MPLRPGAPVAETIHELSHFGKKKRSHKQIVAIAEANYHRRRRGGGIARRAGGGGAAGGIGAAGAGPDAQASGMQNAGGWSGNDYTNAAINIGGFAPGLPQGTGFVAGVGKGIADQAIYGGDQANNNKSNFWDPNGTSLGEKFYNMLRNGWEDIFGSSAPEAGPGDQFMNQSGSNRTEGDKGGFFDNWFGGSESNGAQTTESSQGDNTPGAFTGQTTQETPSPDVGTNGAVAAPEAGSVGTPAGPSAAPVSDMTGLEAGNATAPANYYGTQLPSSVEQIGTPSSGSDFTNTQSAGKYGEALPAGNVAAANAGDSFGSDIGAGNTSGPGFFDSLNPFSGSGSFTTEQLGTPTADFGDMGDMSSADKGGGGGFRKGGGIARRDTGGPAVFNPNGGIAPGLAVPITQIQGQSVSPYTRQVAGQYSRLPTEKLRELSLRAGNGPQAQIIQKLIRARQMGQAPEPRQDQQAPSGVMQTNPGALTQTGQSGGNPVNVDPMMPHRRGGGIQKLAFGGNPMGLSVSEADPWWTRASAREGESGFLHGSTPGRADQLTVTAPSGAYIIPADVVAGLGEGNSLAGARVIDEALNTQPYGTSTRPPRGREPPRAEARAPMPRSASSEETYARGGGRGIARPRERVPVALSHGEYQVSPEDVARIGKGNLKLGHAILDKFVVRARKEQIDKLKKLKGPVKA